MASDFRNEIFRAEAQNFEQLSLKIFMFQYEHNPLYRLYIDALKININEIRSFIQIPFLPIQFFKTQEVRTSSFNAEIIFESSGTTGTVNSRHFIKDAGLYRESFVKGFEQFYGNIKDWCIIGLLPSYLERKNSSLITMVNELIKISGHPRSGFYLYEYSQLDEALRQLESVKQQTMLIGVTFALLDFAEEYPRQLKYTTVMETGGMKGRRKEITRTEAHEYLRKQLGIKAVHSEYGMTELLSQAYSKGDGRFRTVPWMKILIRHEDDPFDIRERGAGIVNVIDLANIYSCSFIATDDVGNILDDGSFEIAGRVDNSDIRGCSLLVT